MGKLKSLIMDAQEMGLIFDTNEDMINYFDQLLDDTYRGECVFARIVRELSKQE